jgi:hypothetical protein
VRRLALILLVACGPDEREAVNDSLPDGVYEPAPGEAVGNASLVTDGDTVWWAYTSSYNEVGHVWLRATTPTGGVRVPKTMVDPDGDGHAPDVALDGDHVVVAMHSSVDQAAWIRAFDSRGVGLTPAPHRVPIFADGELGYIPRLRLASNGAGSIDLLAAASNTTFEIGVVDLDSDYQGTTARTIGTSQPGGPETPSIFGLAGVQRSDGSLVVGWDRNWDQCRGPHPAMALTASLGQASAGPVQPVYDVPERAEKSPAIAAAEDSIYVAWQTEFYYSRSRIALARYPDVATVLVELGEPTSHSDQPDIALAAPGRGAIAWLEIDTNTVSVVGFEDTGTGILVGEPRVFEPVRPGSMGMTRLVHISDERYLLAWTESNSIASRLYARVIDLAGEPRARPVPNTPAAPAPSRVLARPVPCTH